MGVQLDVDWPRVSLANDLASYFSLYRNVVIQQGIQSQGTPSTTFTARTEGDRYYRNERTEDLYFRCAAYPTFMQTLEQVEFDSVTYVNNPETLVPGIGPERVEKLNDYDLTSIGSKINNYLNAITTFDNAPIHGADQVKALIIREAPNQIKALIWNRGTNGADGTGTYLNRGFAIPFYQVVKEAWTDASIYKDIGPAFNYITQRINQIEVLTGYYQDPSGRVFLNGPQWSLLERGHAYGCG